MGLNEKTLGSEFDDETDFCMALSFNKNSPGDEDRTEIGEAEYQLKYRAQDIRDEDNKKYYAYIQEEIRQGFQDLPLPTSEEITISAIPATESGKRKLAWRLAKWLAQDQGCEFLEAALSKPWGKAKNQKLMER